MGVVNEFITGVKKAIPEIARKIGTVFLFIFFLGALFGFTAATKSPLFLFVPLIAMMITYYKLDEGILVFIILTLIMVFI